MGLLSALVMLLASSSVWGYGTGISTYPLMLQKRYISAEFTGITSAGGGVGLQGRYTQKINDSIIWDIGLGMGGGERTSRVFAAADFELFPDYQRQPRVSIKINLENSKDFDVRKNSIGFAPTFSKGFLFWGKEAYPFISVPYNISLNSLGNTYQTNANFNVGVTGNLPIEGYKHLTATLEGTIKIKDSYSGIFLGISYPMN